MKLMKRNLQPVHYCLYADRIPILDDDGYETGETKVGYGEPVKLMCNVSPGNGVRTGEYVWQLGVLR